MPGTCGALPSYHPTWLRPAQEDMVARLTGELAISPGLLLSDRASIAARDATRIYLADYFSSLGLTPKLDDYGTGANVYAELGATTGAGAYVVIGAHFDSVAGSRGANDNATGVAAVLAVARYLSAVDCRGLNVMFVLFDEEEEGLVGSRNFAALLATGGAAVHSVHTIDQMGWDGDGDGAIELERPDVGLFARYSAARASGGFVQALRETSTGSTDHVSFRSRGFAAVGLTEEFVNGDTTPHYHQPGDTYSTVNFAYLQSTTELLLYTFGTWTRVEAMSGAARSRVPWDGPAVFDRRVPVGPLPGRHGCRASSGSASVEYLPDDPRQRVRVERLLDERGEPLFDEIAHLPIHRMAGGKDHRHP